MFKSYDKAKTKILATAFCIVPLVTACGGAKTENTSALPPIDDSASRRSEPVKQSPKGMGTGQKVVLLAGAAALYYMYKKNQAAHSSGANTTEPQYYLSKNGRVYYREKGGRVHWVTPPAEGISVPSSEASEYAGYQGYNGQQGGKDLAGIGNQ